MIFRASALEFYYAYFLIFNKIWALSLRNLVSNRKKRVKFFVQLSKIKHQREQKNGKTFFGLKLPLCVKKDETWQKLSIYFIHQIKLVFQTVKPDNDFEWGKIIHIFLKKWPQDVFLNQNEIIRRIWERLTTFSVKIFVILKRTTFLLTIKLKGKNYSFFI